MFLRFPLGNSFDDWLEDVKRDDTFIFDSNWGMMDCRYNVPPSSSI